MSGIRGIPNCSMLSQTSLNFQENGWKATIGDIAQNLSHLEPLAVETRDRLLAQGWTEDQVAQHKFAHDLTVGCFFEMRQQYEDSMREHGRCPQPLIGYQLTDR